MDDRNTSLSLLIVDDNDEAASFMAEELCSYFNFKVDHAPSGLAALEKVRANPQSYDVALVDQNLGPEMSGVEVIRQLYLMNQVLPVILFTGEELDDEHLSAIEEGAYLYLHLQRGVDTDINQLVFHCRAAARDRIMRWQALFQQMSAALPGQMLQAAGVLNVCVDGLPQLGYSHGAIYRHITGWVPVGEEDAEGFWTAEEHTYMYSVRCWPETDALLSIDLSQASDLKQKLTAGEGLIVYPDDDDTEQIMIPLRSTVPLDRTDRPDHLILGLVVLRHRPRGTLQHREAHLLSELGRQISLALQNALAHRQLEYRREAANQIMVTNARAFRVGTLSLETEAILDGSSIERPALFEAETDAILNQFARSIAKAMDFDRVVVSVVNRAQGTIEVRGIAVQETIPDFDNDPLWRARRKPIDRVEFEKLHKPEYRHHDSYFIPENCYNFAHYQGFIVHYPEVSAAPWERHAGDVFRTEIKNVQGEVLGYISVDPGEGKRRPDDNMFGTLALFASQIAVAIENIYYQKTKEVLQEIGFKISQTGDLHAVFDTVYQQLRWLIHVKSMMVGRYYDARREVEVIYRQKDNSIDYKLSKRRSVRIGLSGYVIRTGKSLLLKEGTEEFLAEHKLPSFDLPTKSWMGAPLKVDGRVVGVIVLQDYEQTGVYDERDLETLELVAAQVAPALRRIELEKAKFEAVHTIGQRSITAQVNLKAVEELILRQACEQTQADYGIIRHYDARSRNLVFSTIYTHARQLKLANEPEPTISLRPQGARFRSLSAKAARARKPMRWGKVREDPDYREVSSSTNSQISVPLLTSSSRRLLGVLTLESKEPDAFEQHHEDMLVVLGYYVSLALLREREVQKRSRLVGWAVADESRRVIRHREVGEARSLSTELETASREFGGLLQQFKEIRDRAVQIRGAMETDLRQRSLVHLNATVQRFLDTYRELYKIPRVILKFLPRLTQEQTVLANALGIQAALKILVDNAYNAVCEEPGGGVITIITDRNDDRVLLHVINTGQAVPEQVDELLKRQGTTDEINQGLVQLKTLLKLYNATVRLTRNMPDPDVRFTIEFPLPQVVDGRSHKHVGHGDTLLMNGRRSSDPQEQYMLQRIRRDIVSYPALTFANTVVQEVPSLDFALNSFTARLTQIQQRVEERRANNALVWETVEYIQIHPFLTDFLNRYRPPHLAPHDRLQDIPIKWNLPVKQDLMVYANRFGLTHILQILLDNAHEAIYQFRTTDRALPNISPVITVVAEERDTIVVIRIHNTGSFIKREIAKRLFEEPLPHNDQELSDRGMGLLMTRVLLDKVGGTINLTLNSRRDGVQFTIVLPTYNSMNE